MNQPGQSAIGPGSRTRKHRRLSLRQAVQCELGLTRGRCRCRCGGSRRGLRRCDAAKPTRWCFAVLPKDDPHYIPAPRRRISPRAAFRAMAHAAERLESRLKERATHATRTALGKVREASRQVAAIVQAERIYSQVRRRKARILAWCENAGEPGRHCDTKTFAPWWAGDFLERVADWLLWRWWPPGAVPDTAQVAAAHCLDAMRKLGRSYKCRSLRGSRGKSLGSRSQMSFRFTPASGFSTVSGMKWRDA